MVNIYNKFTGNHLNPNLPIHPKLSMGKLNYNDPDIYNPRQYAIDATTLHDVLPLCLNRTVQIELWAFTSHLVFTRKLAPSTVSNYIYDLYLLARIIDMEYPDVSSVLDIPIEDMIARVAEKKESWGYKSKPTKYTSTRIDSKGNQIIEIKPPRFETTYKGLWRFLKDAYSDPIPEYEKDVWHMEKLGIPYNSPPHKPVKAIGFEGISPSWLKALVKDFIYFAIPLRTMTTITQYMVVFRHFADFISSEYPKMISLREFDRDAAEGYIRYLGRKGFSASWTNNCISTIKLFFYTELARGRDVPHDEVFLGTDRLKKTIAEPDYFSEFELDQILSHLDDLPPQIARMTLILAQCGMRVSDLCSSTVMIDGRSCLTDTSDHKYTFTYWMPKTHRYNTIPISHLVFVTIQDAIKASNRLVKGKATYIFSQSSNRSITADQYLRQLRAMAFRQRLVTDTGEPLLIKGHSFRGKVATDLANSGVPFDAIRKLLGQKSLDSLRHYVEIHSGTMYKHVQPLLEEDNKLIASIGTYGQTNLQTVDTEPETQRAAVALPNGMCTKAEEAGMCGEITRCLDCEMFRITKEHLPILSAQLKATERNIQLATSQGYTRIAEYNEDLANRLREIIQNIP